MERRWWVGGYRIVFSLLTLAAIGYQIYTVAVDGDFEPADFFNFFTIQSNMLAAGALVFTWLIVTLGNKVRLSLDGQLGEATA